MPKIVDFFYIMLSIVTGVITSCTVHIIFRKLDNIYQFQNQDREVMRKKTVLSFFSIIYIYFKVISGSYSTVVVKLNNNGGENWLKQLMNTRYHRVRSTIESVFGFSGLWCLTSLSTIFHIFGLYLYFLLMTCEQQHILPPPNQPGQLKCKQHS